MARAWIWQTRVYLLTAVMGLALGQRCSMRSPPEVSLDGVAHWLGAESFARVEPESIAWEPSRGPVLDALLGRRVLYLATPETEGRRDVFRARARVSREGKPIQVESVHNLTRTNLGDEAALQLDGKHAVFASLAYGELQGVTLLDLDGMPDDDLRGGWLNRMLLRLRAFQQTGSLQGLGRTHIGIANASRVGLRLDPPLLSLAVGGDSYRLNLDTKRFVDGTHAGLHSADDRAVVSVQRQGGGQWLHTLVDVVRAQTGPDFIAWLEWRAFGLEDQLRRSAHSMFTEDDGVAAAPSPAGVFVQTPADVTGPSWPPMAVPSLWSEPKRLEDAAGVHLEGQWLPFAGLQSSHADTDETPHSPSFVHTFVHPDEQRPYARLWLLAMDMRRMELRMEAGYEEPRPQTGPPGRGALPKEPELLQRVVATFNGAFKSVHGDYGMMVDRRVLVPPKPGAASVVVTEEGRAGLGDWPKEQRIDPRLVSFRQNLDALVSDGQLNPKGRRSWGHRVVGHGALTERSALCLDAHGNLLYAWGQDLTANTLAVGLQRAGCQYALALDMNPGHTGFFFTDFGDGEDASQVQSRAAFAGMRVHPKKYALWSDKDFFYLVRRQSGPLESKLPWSPSVGRQPAPAETPAIFESKMALGTLQVQLLSVDPGRLSYTLTGGREPLLEDRPSPVRRLPPEQQESVMLALTLGHTTTPTRYGLAFGERATLPLRLVYPTLVLGGAADIEIVPAGQRPQLSDEQIAVQLPALLMDGEVTERARQRGARRIRGGLCVLDSGRVYVALVEHDSGDVLALALKQLGCDSALELDRASKHPVQLHRAGTATAPQQEYDTTTLYGIERGMPAWTFRFNPQKKETPDN